MNLFNKLEGEYQKLWKHIVRPNRTSYPDNALGPQTFELQNKKVKRVDFQLINPRGLVFYGSHFIPLQQQSYPCVIYMHGNSSNRTEGMEYLGQLIRRNISLCTFDFSGCGNSEGDYVTLGYYQWEDLHEVVEWIRHKEKITKIAIWGRSMGAVTGLLYLKRSQHVVAAIFDSPFKSLKSLVEDLVQKNSKIPGLIIKAALKIISSTIQQKTNFDIYKLNPLKYQVPFLQFPAFFIVGKDDQLIPTSHTEELFKAYKGTTKQIRIVPGTHNQERPHKCVKEAIQFLEKYLKSKSQWQPKLLPQSKKQIINEVDFFRDEPLHQASQKDNKPNNNDIDFFDIKIEEVQVKPANFNLQKNQQPKQVKQNNKQTTFSFSSMFNNVINKAFNLYSPEQPIKVKSDEYQQLRNLIKTKFKPQESDLTQKYKMQKINQQAKLKNYQIQYHNYKQNEDKLQSWCYK